MSMQQNKTALEGFAQAANAREPLDWYFGPEYVWHGPMGDLDKDGVIQLHTGFLAAFPDAEMTLLDIVAEADKAVTRFAFEGTHKGELMGIPPTGRRVKMTAIIVTRFAGGKAVEEWEESNMLGLMQQLGALPALP